MRVFVSSTVYDLVDIRSELEELLCEMDITPVMSEQNLSGFTTVPDANSIETCLLNVESCDAVIVVLDQRYGPTLGKCGFDDISATHLEYRHAKKNRKPIYFYVRDRLEADFNIHKKNRKNDGLKYSWVLAERDFPLFDFLDEHRQLKAKSKKSNWYYQFSSSVDLKASVRQHFEPVIKPQTLLKAIQENRFPMFTMVVETEHCQIATGPIMHYRFNMRNVSGVPAFDFSMRTPDDEHDYVAQVIPPGEAYSRQITSRDYKCYLEREFSVEFSSSIGIKVRERHVVTGGVQGNQQFTSARVEERTYRNAPPPELEILDL